MNAPAFQQYQTEFTRHIRNPKVAKRPVGVSARRMAVYNEIVFNNFRGLVESCFPVTQEVLGVRRWTRLLREFFIQHQCATPIFRQIPEEFLRWLEVEPPADTPAFLSSLAHYEWVELSLAVSEAVMPDSVDVQGDLLAGCPALAPALALLSYPYAVQRIGKRYKPTQPDSEPTHIVAFRRVDDTVKFIVLNPVSARLLTLLADGALTGLQALNQIAEELQHPKPEVVINSGLEILKNLRLEQAIIGVYKKGK
ncbi:MAG: DUF2063 domain-containing protein [Methylophilaceae bacterium]